MDRILELPLSKKLLLFLAVSTLIDGAIYMLIISDAQGQVQSMRGRLNRQRGELERIKRDFNEDKLTKLQAETSGLKKQIVANEKLLPTRDELAEFLHRIKNHADLAGLTVLRFEKRQKVYEDKYSMIPIRMEVVGTTVNLVKFFRTLADPKERLVSIRELDITWQEPTALEFEDAHEEAELAEVAKVARSGDLRRVNPRLAERLDSIVTLDAESRLGKIRATFTVNAYTFLSLEDRGRANQRRR